MREAEELFVKACVAFINTGVFDEKSLLERLAICLKQNLLTSDKVDLLMAALLQVNIRGNIFRDLFFSQLNVEKLALISCLTTFFKQLKDDFSADFIIERIQLFKKKLSKDDVFQSVKNSDIFLLLCDYPDFKRTEELYRFLEAEGIEFNIIEKNYLHRACASNNIRLVEDFIARGAKLICYDENGKTPLQIAIAYSHAELVLLLITKYAAGVMQEIPDALVSLVTDKTARPIFLGCHFDPLNLRDCFPRAVMTTQELFETDAPNKIRELKGLQPEEAQNYSNFFKEERKLNIAKLVDLEHQKLLSQIANRLEEIIILDPNNENVCLLRRRIRFGMVPTAEEITPDVVLLSTRNKKVPHFGLAQSILCQFPSSLFLETQHPSSNQIKAIFNEITQNNIDISFGGFRALRDTQLFLLNTRTEKLHGYIRALDPLLLLSRKKFNSWFMTLGISTLSLTIAGLLCLLSAKTWENRLIDVFPLILAGLLGVVCFFSTVSLCISPPYCPFPKDVRGPQVLKDHIALCKELSEFITGLPNEDLVDNDERDLIQRIQAINDNATLDEVSELFSRLKIIYQAHIDELRGMDITKPPRFSYQELIVRFPREMRMEILESSDEEYSDHENNQLLNFG